MTIKYPTFIFWKKFILKIIPIFGKKILLQNFFVVVAILYPTFMFRKKFILTWVPIFGKDMLLLILLDSLFFIEYRLLDTVAVEYILLLCLGRKLFWNDCNIVYNACTYIWEEISFETWFSCYCHRVFYFSESNLLFPIQCVNYKISL